MYNTVGIICTFVPPKIPGLEFMETVSENKLWQKRNVARKVLVKKWLIKK